MARISKLFSFTNWAASRPKDPLPGDRVDDEFANHRKVINELDSELKDIRRADGKLNNHLITKDTLDPHLVSEIAQEFRQEVHADVQLATSSASAMALLASEMAIKKNEAESAAIRAEHSAQILDLAAGGALAKIVDAEDRAVQSLRDANAMASRISNDENHAVQSASEAEEWAKVSHAWAEHLDGNNPIPPNILAIMGITGDHWSSRWWANHASQAVSGVQDLLDQSEIILSDFLKRYVGPYSSAPTHDSKGRPIEIGALYWDTTNSELRVWTGSSWFSIIGSSGLLGAQNLGHGAEVLKSVSAGIINLRTLTFENNTFNVTTGADEISIALTAVAWAKLTGVPTTLAGYGISDAYTKAQVDASQGAQDTLIAAKADKSYVDSQDANLTSLISTIDNIKASKAYVDGIAQALGNKDTAQDGVIATKADKSYVDNQDTANANAWANAFNSFTSSQASKDAAQDTAINLRVPMNSASGAANIPAGTTAQRPSGVAGLLRYNSTTKKFEGFSDSWGTIGGGAAISDNAPSNPVHGDIWWNSTDGNIYVYFDDGNTTQWVAVNGPPGPAGADSTVPGPQGPAFADTVIVSASTPDGAQGGEKWFWAQV